MLFFLWPRVFSGAFRFSGNLEPNSYLRKSIGKPELLKVEITSIPLGRRRVPQVPHALDEAAVPAA